MTEASLTGLEKMTQFTNGQSLAGQAEFALPELLGLHGAAKLEGAQYRR